jgi:hypothetical protein
MVHAFRICQTGYIEDPKGHVNKLVVEKNIVQPCIKPPYTNGDNWNVKKCKMLFNIRYQFVISMVY